MSELRRIRSVETKPGHRLAIIWDDDGTTTTVDMTEDIACGGVFAPLRDSKVFNQAELDPRGRVVRWLDPSDPTETLVDIDADALFQLSAQQGSRIVRHRFLRWFPAPAS